MCQMWQQATALRVIGQHIPAKDLLGQESQPPWPGSIGLGDLSDRTCRTRLACSYICPSASGTNILCVVPVAGYHFWFRGLHRIGCSRLQLHRIGLGRCSVHIEYTWYRVGDALMVQSCRPASRPKLDNATMAPKKRASGRYPRGAQTRAAGYTGKSGWSSETVREIRERWEQEAAAEAEAASAAFHRDHEGRCLVVIGEPPLSNLGVIQQAGKRTCFPM